MFFSKTVFSYKLPIGWPRHTICLFLYAAYWVAALWKEVAAGYLLKLRRRHRVTRSVSDDKCDPQQAGPLWKEVAAGHLLKLQCQHRMAGAVSDDKCSPQQAGPLKRGGRRPPLEPQATCWNYSAGTEWQEQRQMTSVIPNKQAHYEKRWPQATS